MMSDATSVGSPAPRGWRRFGSLSRTIRRPRHRSDNDNGEASGSLRQTQTNSTSMTQDGSDANQRELQTLVQYMRAAPAGPSHVDSAYKEFSKIRERCSALCYAILQDEIRLYPVTAPNGNDTSLNRDSSLDSPRSQHGPFDQRSSFSGRSLAEVMTGSGGRSMHVGEPYLAVIREWKVCLETLADAFKTSLAETYRSYERNVTQEMVDTLFANKKFRREAVIRMRNASITKVLSADPDFFPRYEIRFRNYERVKQELIDIRYLLQAGESGISPARQIEDIVIAPRGDAILEFANNPPACLPNEPVLRFRVSSYMLAETSPIFARMFSGHSVSLQLHDNEDINPQLPPPAAKYVCRDGAEANLYRMPMHEQNRLGALELLLHAAHMHNDKVPREIEFDLFVALAECCIKYRCTQPLEAVVEHRWLPKWMHKGADEMPDGLLVISYAFGLRRLFTRMSKSAVLNLVEESDLDNKPWSPALKAKIWAVRCAKVAQVHACCTAAIQDYLRRPMSEAADASTATLPPDQRVAHHVSAATVPAIEPSGTPRCPRGSHSCDAANLGWMMLMFSELGLLGCVLRPECLPPQAPSQPKSLAQLVDGLRRIPSPPAPVHRGGVCDPTVAFRSALNDIYNSVTGLTLYDVSGKSHGWALSKHSMTEPQSILTEGLNRMEANNLSYTVVSEFPETVRLQILAELIELEDLHATAMINRAFYDTYKRHELYLIRNILRADRSRTGPTRPTLPLSISNAEEKVLKKESDELKENGVGEGVIEGADGLTLVDNDDEDSESTDVADDSDIDETPAPSIHGIEDRGVGSVRIDAGGSHLPSRSRVDGTSSCSTRPNPTAPISQSGPVPCTPLATNLEAAESPTTSPSGTDTTGTDNDWNGETPMTEEEALRILWPDAVIERVAAAAAMTQPPPGVEGDREKFLAGDILLNPGLEDKTRVFEGAKQLRSDHEWRVGLLRDNGKTTAKDPASGAKNDADKSGGTSSVK